MEQTELLELITESQTGDRGAQEKLVLAVQNRVYYHCLKTLRSEDDAMDAAQDILISMLSGLNTLRSPESFWAWLNQIICRTCCRRAARQRREVQLLVPEEVLEDNLDDQISPEDALDNEENRRIIQELVDGLPEIQRLCVLMYYYDEMPIKDIAAAMDTTEGTIKSRLHYARQRIKKGVERYTAQGFVLYGVSPLPFLRYFLQQEAARHCLGAAAAKALGEAVLAAGAAAGGAAVGGAAAGAAATGGAAAAGGAAVIAGGTKAAAFALAGLLLAGGITGGILLQRQKAPEPEPVQAIQQEVPVRVPDTPAVRPQPEVVTVEPDIQPEIQPAAPPQIPEKPAAAPLSAAVPPAAVPEPEPETPPAATAPDPAPAAPAEEPDPGPPAWLFPAPKPELEPEPEPIPVIQPSTPQPEPKPEIQLPYVPPVQWPAYETPMFPEAPGFGVDPGPGDDPDPGPSEDPQPEVISKELVDFGHNSGYGYTSRFRQEWGDPLPEDMTFTSSDTDVVKIDGQGFFYTVGPGKAVLTATGRKDDSRQYALTVIVQDQFDWKWTYTTNNVELAPGDARLWSMPHYNAGTAILMSVDWTASPEGVVDITNKIGPPDICWLEAAAPGTAEVTGTVTFLVSLVDEGYRNMQDTFTFQVTVKEPEEVSATMKVNGDVCTVSQFFSGNLFPYFGSSKPEVVSAEDGVLHPLSAGTADIFCYNNENAQKKGIPAAILHITVEPEPEPDPTHHRDISEFGFDFMGYGFTGGFPYIWKGLPKGLEYSSSDDAVVYIDSASGTFYTRTPGTVTLTAVDPEDREHPYTLTLQVQDRFHWKLPVLSDTVYCGSSWTCSFPQFVVLVSNCDSGKIEWTSGDPSIADIDKDYPNRSWYDIRIIGHSPGTATFTGIVTYQLMSPLGIQELTDTVTLEVTVIE